MTAIGSRRQHATAVAHIDHRGRHRREALHRRLYSVAETLGPPPPADTTSRALLQTVADRLRPLEPSEVWLVIAVLSGRLPSAATVQDTIRRAGLDGVMSALSNILAPPRPGWPVARGPWPRVDIITGEVLVDVHHTARTGLATGIQRVARQTTRRWVRDHDVTLVGWTHDLRALRRLDEHEQHSALYGTGGSLVPPRPPTIVVPWRCTYVLPELMTEPRRAHALQGLLRYSGGTGSMIGFDCVPITSAETIGAGMGAGFSMMLTAIAHGQRIATISDSAATEYRGWRTMLSGTGLAGPDVRAIHLPVEATESTADDLARAGIEVRTGDRPMVLCVGSHEPRKNHLAVLHAAELLWRGGHRFSLVFVGGNAWNGGAFEERLAILQEAGRPVTSHRALSDDLLWAAYRLARVVLFPSLNEGFGLPAAEALACGTPVITSDFGSMREIAEAGGALLVDPRDDHQIRNALEVLLTDDLVHDRLASASRNRTNRTWERYAQETWEYLVHGRSLVGSGNGVGES